jgi:PAS domain S-box-containing protein
MEHLLALLVDHSLDGLAAVDASFRYLHWNRAMEGIFGRRAGEVLGQNVFQVLPFLVESGEDALLRQALAGAEPSSRNRPFAVPGTGRAGLYDARYAPLRDGGGAITGVLCMVQDVTDRKRAADHAESALRQALRARDEFLSVASHELRTPLTALQLQLESLVRGLRREPAVALASGRLERNAGTALAQSERMGTLVDVMLDVSRISEGRLPLDYEDLDLAVLVRETAARLARSATDAGSTLAISADRPERGRWDRVRLEQVITNLLSNAIKYGEGKPIDFTVDGEIDRVRLTVRDRGMGIAPAHHARIFDRFERAVSPRHYSGFGIGLWICRRIVDAMKGEIGVESSPGRGATFTVVLPRHPNAGDGAHGGSRAPLGGAP